MTNGWGVGGQLRTSGAGFGGQGVDGEGAGRYADGDTLAGADPGGGPGVQRCLEGDQGVFADPAQVLLGDQVRRGW